MPGCAPLISLPTSQVVGTGICEQRAGCYLLKNSTSERVAYLSKFNNKYRNIILKEGEMPEADELGKLSSGDLVFSLLCT